MARADAAQLPGPRNRHDPGPLRNRAGEGNLRRRRLLFGGAGDEVHDPLICPGGSRVEARNRVAKVVRANVVLSLIFPVREPLTSGLKGTKLIRRADADGIRAFICREEVRMRKVDRFATAALATMLLVSTPADGTSQGPVVPSRDRFWVSAGLGVGSEDFGGSANVAFQHGSHLFSLRTAATAGLFDDGFGDVALLYGYATPTSRRHHAGAAIGIAIVNGCVDPGEGSLFSSCIDQGTVLGLPIEAQLAWLPTKSLGIGLYGFGNLNRRRSFGGVSLSLRLGRVR
jgi:hypothetical protein